MRVVWHVSRAVSAAVLVLFSMAFLRGLAMDDPWASDVLLKIAYSAGIVLPLYGFWRLAVISHQKLKG